MPKRDAAKTFSLMPPTRNTRPRRLISPVIAMSERTARRVVRSDIAMTGEISLRGRVLRVGGIKEKVLAASRFGIKQIVLPDQNRPDWPEVPEEVRNKMRVHFIRHISELLPITLQAK